MKFQEVHQCAYYWCKHLGERGSIYLRTPNFSTLTSLFNSFPPSHFESQSLRSSEFPTFYNHLAFTYPTPPSSFPKTTMDASGASSSNYDQHHRYSPPATTMDASGASSSTAAPSVNSSSHGVFINHRGPDTKKTFASDLYRRLLEHEFRPFLDEQELKVGFNFPSQIVGAIQSAWVHVAIFSPTYAQSQWCLDELVLMLETRAPIIPIFYKVNPADLRLRKGVYVEALNQLQMKTTVDPQTKEEKPRYDSATLQNWRKALSTVADISGFDLNGKFNGDDGLLLDAVVKRVVELMALMVEKKQLYVAKNPTGLDDKLEDFETTVLAQQHIGEVQVIGIVGLGGVGKTTLAKKIFNKKHSEYKNSLFLSDVRENARISLHSLQSKLLKGLFDEDQQIDNIHQGTEVLRRFLKDSKIFLILDDIDHVNQVDSLLPEKNVLDKNSLILITSRDEGVLKMSGVKGSCMYKLTGLPEQHSRELFCLYAFCQPYPLWGFDDLVNKFLKECDGLPLSLIVFGALLSVYDDRSYWEAILHRLELPNEIRDKLKISYDALGNEERQIFLDIACFFIGKNKNSAIAVWNASSWQGSLGFRNLQLKCLAKVDDKDVIHMHDHLRDLGREIAETQSPRRLWRATGNINDWLHQQSSVIMEARGIRMLSQGDRSELLETRSQMLSWYQWRSQQLLGNFLMELCNSLYNIHYCFLGFDVLNLQLLEADGNMLDRILRVRSPYLIWLSWRSCPYKYLPSWITVKNLRVLRLEWGVLETLWQGKWQAPLQLQELEIINAHRLSRIPKSIGQLKHLERILIDSLSLAKLPEEFGDLNSLKALVLHAPATLKSLPDSLGKLRNLHSLDLSGCEILERLPDSFGSLSKLHSLDLTECKKLERLPDSFGRLSNLHRLDLHMCLELKRLPDSFGSLSNLDSLNLKQLIELERLPDSFGSLSKLHSLDLSRCYELERLPDSFGSLSNLHSLYLIECMRLERLPDSFGSLSNLHSLDLSRCYELERLPDSFGSLSTLHSLHLFSCEKLERLPDSFGSLSNLHSLHLFWCRKLKRLPDSFGSLSNLHRLDLLSCSQLERLPDSFGSLSSLEYFAAYCCANLRISSETFGNIRTLQHIDLTNCEKVEVWPWQLGHQRSLKVLKLTGTNFMEELPRAFDLPSDLEVLWIGNPLLDTVIPSLGDLRNLKDLHLEFRGELKCLSASVERSSELSWLKVFGCPIINTSEVFYDNNVVYPKLSELIIEECINLAEVGTLPKALTSVTLDRCYNLRSIEGLSGLPMLQRLRLNGCDNLRSIEGLCCLPRLQWISIARCNELQVPPSVEERLKQNHVTVLRSRTM